MYEELIAQFYEGTICGAKLVPNLALSDNRYDYIVEADLIFSSFTSIKGSTTLGDGAAAFSQGGCVQTKDGRM